MALGGIRNTNEQPQLKLIAIFKITLQDLATLALHCVDQPCLHQTNFTEFMLHCIFYKRKHRIKV